MIFWVSAIASRQSVCLNNEKERGDRHDFHDTDAGNVVRDYCDRPDDAVYGYYGEPDRDVLDDGSLLYVFGGVGCRGEYELYDVHHCQIWHESKEFLLERQLQY